MLKCIIFVLFMIPSVLWAMPCPNGNGILYKGDTVDEVIRQCGEPTTKRTSTRILYTSQDWTYYIPHGYDAGYTQLTISYKNNMVANIHVNEQFWAPICRRTFFQFGNAIAVQSSCNNSYDTSPTLLCGISFGVGDTTERVEALCGPPASQTPLLSESYEMTELVYTGDGAQTITFENGKLSEWQPR